VVLETVPRHTGRAADQRLRADRDRFVAFAFAGGNLLVEIDPESRIRCAVGAVKSLTGLVAEEWTGRPVHELFAADHQALVSRALAHLAQGQQLLPIPVSLATAQPDPRPMVLSACRLPQNAGLSYLSLRPVAPGETVPARDPGTGLLQRAEFEAVVQRHLRVDGRPSDCQLSLLDLSGLEGLCERLDPAAAARVAGSIGESLRRHAVAGNDAGWLEAERFGLLHGRTLDLAEVEDQLIQALRAVDPAGADVAPRSATLGLEAAGLNEADAGKALVYAINAFVRSTEGDFTIRNLRDGFDAMLQETVARIADYRGALDTGAFQLSFQPIVRLSDRTVHHHEALSRAEDGAPIGSVVSFAEELNMVAEFDMMVCRRVADLLAGSGGRRLSIAANLSGRSLENPAFAGALLEMLGRYPQIRGRMLLELTETAQVHDLEKVNAVLQELRRRGFQVCLDDFGSGAATFHYLRAFQVDFVKIDGSLIRSNNHRDHAVLRSVVGLCREIKVATIAEMIETAEQASWLARAQVTHGQGYLFGRPAAELPAR
jgi:EAL domain-containing protein (putative c-di-GMP-specific phosphodiesterase class I)